MTYFEILSQNLPRETEGSIKKNFSRKKKMSASQCCNPEPPKYNSGLLTALLVSRV